MRKIAAAVSLVLILFVIIRYWPTEKHIKWREESGFRWAKLSIPKSSNSGFKQLSASETGITFTNNLTKDQIDSNRVLLNGSGVAVGDIDGDELADLYFSRLNGPNVLYKNLGNWKFEDITAAAGVACAEQYSSGTAFADIDGDGDLDLLVIAWGGPNACFLNDGTGKFTEITTSAGISSKTGASTMALADIDGDGDLDLYITNNKKIRAEDIYLPGELAFENIVEKVGDSYRIAPKFQEHYSIEIRSNFVLRFETAEPDILYLNDGKGHFNKVSFTDGRFLDEEGKPVSKLKDWGLMTRFQDMDDDGDPDIYVCNDFESPDRIWINDGKGYFQAIPKIAIRKTSNSTMAVDFSDIDRDGDLDFFVVDMLSRNHRRRMTQMSTMVPIPFAIGTIDNRPQYMRNTLFLNRGDKTYAEIAHFSGVQASEWSWSNLFLDVDLDGYEDVLVSTGHYYDAQDYDTRERIDKRLRFMKTVGFAKPPSNPIFLYPRLELPNIAFRNRGDLTFEEVGQEWGFASTDISHGMALGDFDNDGDLDVVINRFDAPAGVYRNESVAPRIAVRLRGLPPNTQGIGAKIRVVGGPVPQSKEVICAGTYLSSSDPFYVFAAGEAENDLTIEVKWRNGKISVIKDVKPNRVYEIYESAAISTQIAQPTPDSIPKPYFEDVSELINHTHHEDPYDDFKRQPLLPNRLSQLGPGVAWHDLDGDGDDDLVITSGKGGQLAYFRNDDQGGFHRIQDRLLTQKSQYDQTTVLGWTKEDGSTSLLVGCSNFENSRPSDSFVLRYDFKHGQANTSNQIVGDISSTGPMTMADYDSDGDLDLFVGGRTIPARYPEPASSELYRNEGGNFKLDTLNTEQFKEVGLVSGAVFSDYDNDGDADLILAVEWGPVMVFRNEGGVFTDATEALGLSEYHGWWHGVTTGDLNEDGKLDIIATNWGLNSKYQDQYENGHPLRIFYSDFDYNGTLDIVEAYFDPVTQKLVPERDRFWMLRALPNVRIRIPNHKKYSRSSIQEIIGPKLRLAGELRANTLAHTIFFNRGTRFEAVEMPAEAQFAPAFYVGVADFDGDGHEDVFLSQNFFDSQVITPRSDAGRGLWLKGDGNGRLEPIPGQESGVKVYGEQRGAALGDYDRDGRVDLVVSQNGASTKLYHNVGAKPGLRIRLHGPKGNPWGVGAIIRLVYENRFGPAREIHLGSGYWSQDSRIQIMGTPEQPKGVWVRWPDGHITQSDIPHSAREIIINFDGKVIIM
ncbi:MAG: VCBS repeat-containing protein [bacterium]